MKDMPPSARDLYELWISQYPESWHPSDLERFYMFLSVLLQNMKKERSRSWLEKNLREDCNKLTDEDIRKYGDIYEHIRDFKKVWKSRQAHQFARDKHESGIRELKKRI